MTAAVLCTEETAACLIPHLISELETPCPCRRHDGLYLTGTSIDGRQVSITVKKGVLEGEGISQEELDALADRRCQLRTASAANSPPSARPKTLGTIQCGPAIRCFRIAAASHFHS